MALQTSDQKWEEVSPPTNNAPSPQNSHWEEVAPPSQPGGNGVSTPSPETSPKITSTDSPPQEGPLTRFTRSYAGAVGAPEKTSDFITGPLYALRHPIDSAELLTGGIKDSMSATIAKGQARSDAGQSITGAYQKALGYVPIFGPMLSDAGEAAERGDYASMFGTVAGLTSMEAAGHYAKSVGPKVDPSTLGATLDRSQVKPAMAAPPHVASGNAVVFDKSTQAAIAPNIPKGEGTSAVHLVDQPPSTSPEAELASHTAEIARMQSVIDNPKATPQERSYALDARASSIEARDNLARPQSRIEPSEQQPGVLPPRIAPEIAPEPVERGVQGLAPEHQEIVTRIENASDSPSAGVPPQEAANRKMVEDLGGEWHGSDDSGLSHFNVPEAIVGRKGVTVSAPTDKLTPDYIQEQFQRKAQEFAPKPIPPDADAITRLNTLQGNSFKKIVELKNARETATDDGQRSLIDTQIKEELSRSKQIQDLRIQTAGPEGLQELRDQHAQKAQWYKNRERGINNLQDVTERNASTAKQISEMRATRPEGEVVDPETGEKVSLDTGAALQPLARSIYDVIQNRKPRYTLDNLQINAPKAGVDSAEWKTFTDNMMSDLRKRYAEITRDIAVHQDTSSTSDLLDTDIPDRIRELDKDASLIGQFDKDKRAQKQAGIRTDVGRRPHLAPPLNADGNITDPAALWTMDQKTWDKITGVNNRKGVPESNEVRQFAKNQGLFGELHDAARAHVDKVLNPIKQAASEQAASLNEPRNPEAGFAGERTPKPFQVPDSKTLVKRGIDAGIPGTHMITDEKPSGYEGWITKDGKGWIGRGDSHDTTAHTILPEIPKNPENVLVAQQTLINDGAIRKQSPTDFEVKELDDKRIKIIEMDTIVSGNHGHAIQIDTAGDYGTQSLVIERGWEDLADGIREAKKHGYLDPSPNTYTLDAGKVPGAINLGAASIGAVGGHIVGGLPGAVAGFTLGYISPELIRSPFVQGSFKAIGPFLTRVGVDAKDWVYGSRNTEYILPVMKDILDQQQRDPEGSGLGTLDRLSQLPTDARRFLINKFAILDDQRSPGLASAISKYDKRVPTKRPSLDNSPYVSLADAVGNIRGRQDDLMIQFSEVENKMKSAGVSETFLQYMNLKAYEGKYNLLEERVKDGVAQIKAIDQQLGKPNLAIRDRIRLEDQRKSVKDDANEAFNKLSGKDPALPGGIKAHEIPDYFNALKDAVGPQKYALIEAGAKHIFDYHRQAINLAHDSGMLGDEMYNKFIARGNEYVSMSRIMTDLADQYARTDKQGKASPMYVSKQNIIRNFEGSERVNQNPYKANLMIDREILSESIRNQVVGGFIDYAEINPNMYGPDNFKKVGPNYQPLKGEAIITHYEKGKPVTYKVSDDIYQSLQGASPVSHDLVKEALGSFYKLTRAGATVLNLGFQLKAIPAEFSRTWLLSSQSGLELSGNWMKFGRMWAKNLGSSLVKGSAWQEGVRNGYLYTGLQRLIAPEMQLETASLGVGPKIARLRLISAADDLLSAHSDAIKMTGYQMLREQGYSEKAALYNTKRFVGMPDYSQSGAMHPAVKYLTMFFNADLQHVAQSMNALADKPEKILPKLAALTAMTMALQQWNYSQKDEDGQPLMRKITFDERNRNFVFLTGGTHSTPSGPMPNKWLIRKPDMIAWTINPTEQLISKAIGHEERSSREIIMDATKSLTPFAHGSISDEHPIRDTMRSVGGSLNPLIRIPLEEATNRNFGTGSPIVSRDQIDPRYQATVNTPSLYTRVGEATGISPQRLQHASGVTGGLIDTIAQQVDPLLRGNKPAPSTGSSRAMKQVFVIGQALASMSGSDVNQEELTQTARFYDRAEQFKQVQQTFDYLKKSNPAKAQEFVQQNKRMLALASVASDAKSSLAELGQMRAEVQSNPKIDDATRSTQLANIAKARMRYLKAYNSAFDKYLK